MRGLDPRIHLLVKRMDCRVKSAFTRVFRRAMPGNDEFGTITAFYSPSTRPKEIPMTITVAHITPLVALIAGILILLVPRLLNYVVAIYLIIVGLVGLNGLYHFIR